jgi:hypothetical protein
MNDALRVSRLARAVVLGTVGLGFALSLAVLVGQIGSAKAADMPGPSWNTAALPMQGVTVTGLVTYGTGTCFPDAVLLDCNGAVSRELRGPGGAAFFAPYVGSWVEINGAEQQCQPGATYVDVVNIHVVADPCGGAPTPTPGGPTPPPPPATATPVATAGPSPTPPGTGNLALGKQFFASTTQPPHDPNFAGDGNLVTSWLSYAGRHPYFAAQNQQWIYVDLGLEYSVQDMHMKWNKPAWAYPRGYTVYAWLDYCGGWCRLASTSTGTGDDPLHLPMPVEARYFMLWLVNPVLIGGPYDLLEWEIGGLASIQTANVAAGKPAVALNSLPGFEAPKATDADAVSDWRGVTIPNWIYVNFGTGVAVDRARLLWSAGQHATQYALYAWNGYGWVPLNAVNAGVGGDETVRFAPVRTQYIMLYAAAGPGPGVALREFEVYEYRGTPGGPYPDSESGFLRRSNPGFDPNSVGGLWNGMKGGGAPSVDPTTR